MRVGNEPVNPLVGQCIALSTVTSETYLHSGDIFCRLLWYCKDRD